MRPSDGVRDPLLKFMGPGDVLGLPLLAHGELNGVMWIGATPDQVLSQRKAALFGGIANQAAMAIETRAGDCAARRGLGQPGAVASV